MHVRVCACVNVKHFMYIVFVSKGLLESHVVSEPELGESEAEDGTCISNPKTGKSVLPQVSRSRRTQVRGGVVKYGKEESHDGPSQNSRTGAVSECSQDDVKSKKKKAHKFLFYSYLRCMITLLW